MHRTGQSNKTIVYALQTLNISRRIVGSGWGTALDRLYDLIGLAIEKTVILIRNVAEENLSGQKKWLDTTFLNGVNILYMPLSSPTFLASFSSSMPNHRPNLDISQR